MKQAQHILSHLRSLKNKANQEGMARFAIGKGNTLGIKIPVLRELAKQYRRDPDRHAMAAALWQSGVHEAMLLAGIIADPKQVSPEQMDRWTEAFYSWDLCGQFCGNLFQKVPFFLEKAFAYSHRKEEFVKRTGFVLFVQYAGHHKKADDALCLQFLQRIEEEAWDNRNFVKKALNWCLRQIGKRNERLQPKARVSFEGFKTLRRLLSPSACWNAREA